LATGAWGWHVETGLHALRLIVAGVFDRFPRLQMILGHMGEGLPAMIWRADSVLNPITTLSRPVRDYFRTNFHVTTSAFFDRVSFAAAVTAIGIDRVLFSVDYPYSSNVRAREFLDRLALDDGERELVSHRNAERLLGPPVGSVG
jgi:predicted TIM-barrel fold metal-dependent hydrolase